MAKVITFSRTFPSYHPKAGKPTRFVEKILNWYWDQPGREFHNLEEMIKRFNPELYQVGGVEEFVESCDPDMKKRKHHTIRSGHRWKAGDWFSPRVWSGKPYNSKQIQFAPDIQIKKVWTFNIADNQFWLGADKLYSIYQYADIAKNDGLDAQDFWDWFQFPKPFEGQIICWNENIEY